MSLPLMVENLAAWSLQIAVLAAVGSALPALLRVRVPGVLVAYRQALLAACLALPLAQPWKLPPPAEVRLVGRATIQGGAPARQSQPRDVYAVVAWVLVGGIVARFSWLSLGLVRLRRYRRRAERLEPLPPAVAGALANLGVRADFGLSGDVNGPVTFGWRSPTILLPVRFLEMDASRQLAICCHELVHVRRRDWLFTMFEEVAGCLFWFHPGIWWLIAQTRLAREQAVDREVVGLTRARESYLEALLDTAHVRELPAVTPVSTFLSKRHLSQRVCLLLQEVSMSRPRLLGSLAAVVAGLALSGAVAIQAFPLQAQPPAPQRIRVGGNVQSRNLIYKQNPTYPPEAKVARLQGVVLLTVLIGKDGWIQEIQNVSGPPALIPPSLEAVKNWRYRPTLLNGEPVEVITQIDVNYTLSSGTTEEPAAPAAISGVVGGVPGGLAGGVIGGTISAEPSDDTAQVMVFLGADREKLKPTGVSPLPVYPPLARQARIRGSVELKVSVDSAGAISNIAVVSGHPLLIPASIEALKQWRFEPSDQLPGSFQVTFRFGRSGEGSQFDAAPFDGARFDGAGKGRDR